MERGRIRDGFRVLSRLRAHVFWGLTNDVDATVAAVGLCVCCSCQKENKNKEKIRRSRRKKKRKRQYNRLAGGWIESLMGRQKLISFLHMGKKRERAL